MFVSTMFYQIIENVDVTNSLIENDDNRVTVVTWLSMLAIIIMIFESTWVSYQPVDISSYEKVISLTH